MKPKTLRLHRSREEAAGQLPSRAGERGQMPWRVFSKVALLRVDGAVGNLAVSAVTGASAAARDATVANSTAAAVAFGASAGTDLVAVSVRGSSGGFAEIQGF
jgi:hypothetical protein